MDKLKPITLVEQVTDRVVRLVQEADLRPGDELPSTSDLSERFGVSRSVVREALKSLEAQAIIRLSNGKRPVLRGVSLDSMARLFAQAVRLDGNTIHEFMEIRKGLEIHSAGLAASRHTDEDSARIDALLRQLADSLYDVEKFSYIDAEFHLAIAEATRNVMLAKLLGSIRETIQVVSREGRLRRLTPDQVSRVQELHERLVRGVLSRDATRAQAAMEAHFDHIAMSLGWDNE